MISLQIPEEFSEGDYTESFFRHGQDEAIVGTSSVFLAGTMTPWIVKPPEQPAVKKFFPRGKG